MKYLLFAILFLIPIKSSAACSLHLKQYKYWHKQSIAIHNPAILVAGIATFYSPLSGMFALVLSKTMLINLQATSSHHLSEFISCLDQTKKKVRR